MPILATVQGNIGGGKSTLVEYLCLKYRMQNNTNICFIQEPVDEWNTVKDSNGKTMLELFYGDQPRYAFGFQMMAYISRLALLKRTLAQGYDVIVSERSLDTDRYIFAKMLYDDSKIMDVEYQIYLKWFDEFTSDFPKEHIIYIKTTPEIAHARVEKRARKGEIIPFEYMKKCHQYHENWIKTTPPDMLCIIDGNIDITKQPETFEKWKTQIDDFLQLT